MVSDVAYRKLDAWQLAMEFVEECDRATRSFPREEMYGLTAQLRRAAVSIPSNIAEGYCRHKTKAYANHISIALGSHAEVETQIEIAFRLGFLTQAGREALERQLAPVGRLLNGLRRSLLEQLRRQKPKPNRRGTS